MRTPYLAPDCTTYLDSLYQTMLVDGSFVDTGDIADNLDLLDKIANIEGPFGCDTVPLGASFALDVYDTFLNYPRDYKKYTPDFLHKTDLQVKTLKTGRKVDTFLSRHGADSFIQETSSYCPELVAWCGTVVVRYMFELPTRRSFRQFLSIIKVPPAFR